MIIELSPLGVRRAAVERLKLPANKHYKSLKILSSLVSIT